MGGKVYYGDTDSIFTNVQLPDIYLNSNLGYMKDELDGGIILKAYFFNTKRYALIIRASENFVKAKCTPILIDGDNSIGLITKFTGVKSNSITLDEINLLDDIHD